MIPRETKKPSIDREYSKEIFNRSFFSRYRVGEKFDSDIWVNGILSVGFSVIRRMRLQIRQIKTGCNFS